MRQLVQLGATGEPPATAGTAARRPAWLRVKIDRSDAFADVGRLLGSLQLHTVCQEARCPNIWECWGQHRTATLMICGDVCTRACRYCSVHSGRPAGPPDPAEPERVADAVERLELAHAVITSVDRDDLADFGAGHWVRTIEAIRARRPQCRIELLIPDFGGDAACQARVFAAHPDVLGHNVETVPRLYRRLRSRGDYDRALTVLRRAAAFRDSATRGATSGPTHTKSGMMLGLGETPDEVLAVMDDLRANDCDVLTLGQYLNPTKRHAPIARFYTPEEFEHMRQEGLARGFKHVQSGPLVRSSYHAHEHVPVPVPAGPPGNERA